MPDVTARRGAATMACSVGIPYPCTREDPDLPKRSDARRKFFPSLNPRPGVQEFISAYRSIPPRTGFLYGIS